LELEPNGYSMLTWNFLRPVGIEGEIFHIQMIIEQRSSEMEGTDYVFEMENWALDIYEIYGYIFYERSD